jgi:hypothetical protein
VTDLARVPVGTRLDGARDADGAGDAGAQRHEQEPVRALARADPAFGEATGADVVAERDRYAAESFTDQLPQRNVTPAQVGGVDGGPVFRVDDAGHGDPRGGGPCAQVLLAVRVQIGGEAQDRLHDGLGAAVPAGGPARLVEQGAVGPDQSGLHSCAAHIEGDDVSHGRQFRPATPKRSSPLSWFVDHPYKTVLLDFPVDAPVV